MNPTQIDPSASRPAPAAAGATPPQPPEAAVARPPVAPQFLLCEHCQAPVEREQRYCVRCGARQSHAPNPATTYFAATARDRRTMSAPPRREGGLRALALALALVLLPIAVGIGVLVGRGATSNDDGKLIAALAKAPVVAAAGTAAAPQAGTGESASAELPSDFPLTRGFTVKLSTLPLQGTGQAAVSRAEQQARAKGASEVGLINPKDFRITPAQGSSSYIIYSGQFKARAQAQKALSKLHARFPAAEVIEVAQAGSKPAPVLEQTEYGTVHQVAGSRATPQQLQEDKKVVQRINHTVGKSYVEAQKNLPDMITVTGGGSTPNQSADEKLGEG